MNKSENKGFELYLTKQILKEGKVDFEKFEEDQKYAFDFLLSKFK